MDVYLGSEFRLSVRSALWAIHSPPPSMGNIGDQETSVWSKQLTFARHPLGRDCFLRRDPQSAAIKRRLRYEYGTALSRQSAQGKMVNSVQ